MSAPDWPAFSVGSRDAMFALGAVVVKYTDLESVSNFMFATVFSLGTDDATMIAAKIGSGTALGLMLQKLEKTEWTAEHKDRMGHFLKAFAICTENRNNLLHSSMAWIHPDPILFKTSKQGNTIMATPTIDELRQVADEMNLYADYGRMVGNAINNARFDPPIFAGAGFPLPDKPPLPHALAYTADLHPL